MADTDSLSSDDALPTRLGPRDAAQDRPLGSQAAPAQPIETPPPGSRRPSTGSGDWEPPGIEDVARLLPQYRIQKLLGRGGMAAVYKGLQIELDRPVAIKLLPAELATDAEFVNRFRREARMLAKLQHPGIVAIYDFGLTIEGHMYFVMEYVDGLDLSGIIRGPGLDSAQTLELICQICDALHYAHLQGVIHRDIKPSNILVSREGCAKLADFGLARPQYDDYGLTGSHVIMGTPDYMAPEQCDGHADHRADIFALGVTLYVMLTGRPPRGAFQPASRRAGVDARIDDVVLRALQADPDERYQQVSELKAEVDRIRTGPPESPILPAPEPVVAAATAAPVPAVAPAVPVAPIIRVPRPNRWKPLVIPALVLLPFLGLGAFFVVGPGRTHFGGKRASGSSADAAKTEHVVLATARSEDAITPVASAARSPNRGNQTDAPARPTLAFVAPSAPVVPATPAPEPDLASIERARAAAELEKQRKEEEIKRKEKEKRDQEIARQKMEDERQRLAKIDADAGALRKAGELEPAPLLASAAGGDSAAQSLLALWQREGYKLRKDPAAALRWAGLAAGQGNPVGQAALAFLNLGEDGLKADRDQAAKLAAQSIPGLKELAAKNEPAACYALGRMYALGIGTPRDPAAAADLYRPSAQQGFALAQHALGVMYESGDGVPKDPAQARSLFDQAATAYLLKRESVSTPGGIVGLEPGTPVVIVAQKGATFTVKTKNYLIEVAETDLTRNAKGAQAMLEQIAAAQRAYKEKAAAELLAQNQQRELAIKKATAALATPPPARPLTPAEQLAALQDREKQIGAQLSDVSSQLGQVRVVGNVRTSPNAAAAMNQRKALSDQITDLNRQLRDVRAEEAQLRAALNARPSSNANQGPALRGATLQPARGL